ncbi:NADPH-glutathione reductase [Ectothiorhodosinus mongolicus]|uniref:NADPH-glutathione reductase n=1 Tax=Ectothiorhodosinus mongolicus TaxID=233100 RepID=A0A1R3VWZ1_9GAMM|nr:glutathione-disulfide reductase [Ectothiorhodosinus mongolicus]ULX57017.1 glutathione-disulfide reductase [Ectothiorhodosinus mongolicus]SIT69482.1 NADPH-glutathione reductase [Ectothiorhodosinus mongolicus]
MAEHYDLLTIGAGSGGLSVAERAAQYGAHCAVIESGRLGGTCVNVGCVPKKIMWYAADAAHRLHNAAGFGHKLSYSGLDWLQLVTAREKYIQGINDWYSGYLADAGIDLITGQASFVDKKTIAIGEQKITADHIVIATGGYPALPDIPGAELGISSDGFFALREQPRSVAIVGAGYIAVELACMLNALGSEVTLFMRHKTPLRSFDAMLRETLMQQMQADGIQVTPKTEIGRVLAHPDSVELIDQSKHSQGVFEQLIWAIGRHPASQDLDLQKAGLTADTQGYITTDLYQNTEQKDIYAVGDVTGRAQLTPVAIAAGRRLADRLFGKQPDRHLDYELIPSVVFSHPPIGSVGLTEEAARASHGDAVKVYSSRFTPMQHALAPHPVPTAMKLITLGPEEKVIGLHICGPDADEMLQGFAVAIRMGACKRDLDDTIALHPTSAEELVTMK